MGGCSNPLWFSTGQLDSLSASLSPPIPGFAAASPSVNPGIRHIEKLLGHVRLETTTIYTKVAVRTAGRIDSPLDKLRQSSSTSRKVSSVGTMTIKLERLTEQNVPGARVRLSIARHPQPVEPGGIVVKESRPGWLSLDLPLLELWEQPLKQLTPSQRARIESPEFYQLLQGEVTRRYLARIRGPG